MMSKAISKFSPEVQWTGVYGADGDRNWFQGPLPLPRPRLLPVGNDCS